MTNEITTIRKSVKNDIMSSFIDDMAKSVNIKAIIVIEADSGLSKTKKIRLGYAGTINGQDFKFEPTNYKFKTENIHEKVIKPVLDKFSKFDKVTSEDFKFASPEDFIKNVFENVETGIDEDED
jgi:hypothetical protein